MQRWYKWLYERKKRRMRIRGRRSSTKSLLVVWSRVRKADQAFFFWHTITKLIAWRGGVQMLEKEEEDVKPSAKCEEKRRRMGQALAVRHGGAGLTGQAVEKRGVKKVWKKHH